MKSGKVARMNLIDDDLSEVTKKAVKLAPNKKSGKLKHNLAHSMNNNWDEDEDDEMITSYVKKESILDYYDDED